MTMLQYFFVISIFAAFSTRADIQPNVKVKGSEELKEDAVVELSGLGKDPNLSPAEAQKRLQTSGLFTKVAVRRSQNFTLIDVDEKANWFVLPYFSADQEAFFVGAAFGKAVLFGQDRKVMGRFQMGTDNREGSFLFRDESVGRTSWQLGFSLDYENALHRVFSERKVIRKMGNYYFGGSIQSGYRITSDMTLSFNNYIEDHHFESESGKTITGIQWTHKLIFDLNRYFSNEGLTSGTATRVYFEGSNPASSFSFQKVGAFFEAGVFQFGNLNWISRNRIEKGFTLPRYQLFEMGGPKLRGFPAQNFRSDFYYTTQNDFLIAAWSFWSVILRPLVFIDWSHIESGGRTGTGAGFHVYFKNIAIPAVQVFGGYGFHPSGFSLTAAIGPQF